MLTFPELFVERTKALLGDEYLEFEEALQLPSPVSIRVNDKRCGYEPSNDRVAWCGSGFYLKERPLFTADPLFHAGVYYVQEASSMFLEQLVALFLKDAGRVLDLCAAPGGKSTLLLQALSPDALLISNEFVRSRAMILSENIVKWGSPNVLVTNNSPEDFGQLPNFFDAIVVDAPCSGEGMFRKDEGAIAEWSVQNVKQCAIRQKSILRDSWGSLKEGGLLIYSTCTYNREENEDNVAWLCRELGADCLKPDIGKFDGVVESEYGWRFYPHKIRGEGFFIAVVRKKASSFLPTARKPKKHVKYVDSSVDFKNRIKDSADFAIKEVEGKIVAFSHKHFADRIELGSKLNCLNNGVVLAEMKGKDVVPAHQFALSKIIRKEVFNAVELDLQNAHAFLRKEALSLPENTPRGYLLVCFQGQAVGWIKNLGNRSNNLYPQHWRIRMHL